MANTKCIFEKECPVRTVCFKYPEYLSNKRGQGCLFAHIIAVLKKWEEIEEKYTKVVNRAIKKLERNIPDDIVEKLIKIMLILHDYGKASKEYLTWRHFYHEILSASIIYKAINLEKNILSLVSAAVFLHHEHRIYYELKRTGYWEINQVVLREITKKHLPLTIQVDHTANESFIKLLHWAVGNSELISSQAFKEKYDKKEIEGALGEIVNQAKASGREGARKLLILGILNHILIITDIRAANMTREPSRNKLSMYFKLILYGGRLGC